MNERRFIRPLHQLLKQMLDEALSQSKKGSVQPTKKKKVGRRRQPKSEEKIGKTV